jgi:hypothetical protein
MEGTEILKALQYNREAEAVERVRNELAEYQQLHQESQRKNTDLLGDLKILARDHQTLLSHVDGIVKEFHKAREISAEATSFTKELGSSKEAATDLIIKCFIVSFLKETVVPVFINHTRRETTEFDQWAIYIAKRILADLKSEDQRAIRQTAEEQAEAIAAKRKELLEVTEAMTELNQQNQKCFQTKSGIVVRQVQEQTQALDQQISRQRKLVEQLAEISGTKKRTRNLKKMKEDVISKISNIHSRNHLDSNSSTWLNAVYETLKSELLPYARGLKENISGGDEHFQSISWVFDNMSEESKKSLLIKEDFPVLEERFLGPIMQEIVRVKTNKLSFPRGG